MPDIPIPPLELRKLIGHTDESAFLNPDGADVFPGCDTTGVLDLGCGCGRVARRLMLQANPPERYLGIDINKPMIDWCRVNLSRPGWSFEHMDAYSACLNPRGLGNLTSRTRMELPLPAEPFTLAVAWSLFTHVIQEDAGYYLRELSRGLTPRAKLISTWFLFDKTDHPYLQSFQHALYCNLDDPTNAVVYDKDYVRTIMSEAGFGIEHISPPSVRGFQWTLESVKGRASHVPYPPDLAAPGVMRAPL